jgi:hypothetical protein
VGHRRENRIVGGLQSNAVAGVKHRVGLKPERQKPPIFRGSGGLAIEAPALAGKQRLFQYWRDLPASRGIFS